MTLFVIAVLMMIAAVFCYNTARRSKNISVIFYSGMACLFLSAGGCALIVFELAERYVY